MTDSGVDDSAGKDPRGHIQSQDFGALALQNTPLTPCRQNYLDPLRAFVSI